MYVCCVRQSVCVGPNVAIETRVLPDPALAEEGVAGSLTIGNTRIAMMELGF